MLTMAMSEESRRFVTDAKGRVSLPAVSEWAMVTARRANEYGFVSVRRKHKPVEVVTLVPDETLLRVAGVDVGKVRRQRDLVLCPGDRRRKIDRADAHVVGGKDFVVQIVDRQLQIDGPAIIQRDIGQKALIAFDQRSF